MVISRNLLNKCPPLFIYRRKNSPNNALNDPPVHYLAIDASTNSIQRLNIKKWKNRLNDLAASQFALIDCVVKLPVDFTGQRAAIQIVLQHRRAILDPRIFCPVRFTMSRVHSAFIATV